MAKPSPPMGALHAAYGEILTMCDGLEALADALPGRVDPALCHRLIIGLEPSLTRLQAAEGVRLFPLLLVSDPDAVERRKKVHRADSAAAAEVSDALRALMRGADRPSADALGYLLRAFFDSMRRHVATENEWLRLLALTPGKIAN